MVAESDLCITPEHVPSRFERLRANFKIFHTGFFPNMENILAVVPSLAPIPQETIDERRASICGFILEKEIGTTDFRASVAEHMAEIRERQEQREALTA